MVDSLTLWLEDAEITHYAGKSLACSLYAVPLDMWLTGPLGAGKTTFVQGFAEGLGIRERLTSPTYALEQRYNTRKDVELLHLDLYRLSPNRAAEMSNQSDDHTGIRCIEWSERIDGMTPPYPLIRAAFSEEGTGRVLTLSFEDMALPTYEDIEQWRKDVLLPPHIAAHCDAVAEFAGELAEYLIGDGMIVRRRALERAGQVHDLLRFVDFHADARPAGIEYPKGSDEVWAHIKKKYPNMRHEDACTVWLTERGYPHLAEIVRVHGLHLPAPERTTIEQKLLYYADKRIALDTVVSIDERFDDFTKRYGKGIESENARIWRTEAKHIEDELFPDGPPR